jgi:putative iron-regulated protein
MARVRDEWAPGNPANYRAELLALPLDEALSRILTGLGTLAFGELRGERLVVPYTTKLQEDEHSCFSDNTHVDHLLDMRGIENIWLGRYVSSRPPRRLVDPSRDLARERFTPAPFDWIER